MITPGRRRLAAAAAADPRGLGELLRRAVPFLLAAVTGLLLVGCLVAVPLSRSAAAQSRRTQAAATQQARVVDAVEHVDRTTARDAGVGVRTRVTTRTTVSTTYRLVLLADGHASSVVVDGYRDPALLGQVLGVRVDPEHEGYAELPGRPRVGGGVVVAFAVAAGVLAVLFALSVRWLRRAARRGPVPFAPPAAGRPATPWGRGPSSG